MTETMRRIARILLGAGLVVAILLEVAWLASGPLFEHVLGLLGIG